MSLQEEIVKVLTILVLSIGFIGGVIAFANNDTQYKTFQSEDFGFSISYPESWRKKVYPEEGKPQIYRETYLRLSEPENLDFPAVVTVMVDELAGPASLQEFKQYVELGAKFSLWPGGVTGVPTEIHIGEFADSRAVIVKSIHTSFYKKTLTDKSGTEEIKWRKSQWRGKLIGVIRDGYLYRIAAGSHLESYQEANEKYLSKILDSFEFGEMEG